MDKKLNDEWIVVSSCSFYMCLNKNCFLELEKTTRAQVIMCNNMTCKISGIGIVKLLMENINVLFLKGAKHVLEIERNLFL